MEIVADVIKFRLYICWDKFMRQLLEWKFIQLNKPLIAWF